MVNGWCVPLPHAQCGHLQNTLGNPKKSINRRNHEKNNIQGQNKHIRSAETSEQKVFGPSWRGGGQWRRAKADSWAGHRRPFYVWAKRWAWQNDWALTCSRTKWRQMSMWRERFRRTESVVIITASVSAFAFHMLTLMMIAFITINSGWVPLIEGLCA